MTTGLDVRNRESGSAAADPRARWGLPQYMALVGAVFVAWQAWTWIAWATDNPHSITGHQVRSGPDWWTARIYEGLAILVAIGVIVYLVRKFRRDGEFGFDGQICVAGMLTMWLDVFTDFLAPIFTYGQNWINVNFPGGYAPFTVNPTSKTMPWAIVFTPLLYTFGLLALAIGMDKLLRSLRSRWPGASTAKLLLAACAVGFVFDFLLEAPLYLTNNFNWIGLPHAGSLWLTSKQKFPLAELIPAAMFFAFMGAIRFFKNDRGEAITERGLERYGRRKSKIISQLALVGMFCSLTLSVTLAQAFLGIYSSPPRALPPHGLNDLCDIPASGVTGTAYGPCPGEPGWVMHIRSLPKR